MANILKRGAEWLERKRTEHLALSVTYRRGASSVDVSATIGRKQEKDDSLNAIYVQLQIRDYLILVADLVLDGSPVTPVAGDRIIETIAGTAYTYEVCSPTEDIPAAAYSDDFRITWRIHTKFISSGVAP